MIGKILIGIAGMLALFAVVVATRPSAYHVERGIEVGAPAELVFEELNDLRRFVGVMVLFGTPWEEIDSAMKTAFEGPAAGVGQSYAWSSGKDAGTGRMSIVESVPGRKVGVTLAFEKPMKSTAMFELTLAATPTGARVSWSMDGKHNFAGKAFGIFMDMDSMLGADIDKGLARLKSVAEARQAASAAAAAASSAQDAAHPLEHDAK